MTGESTWPTRAGKAGRVASRSRRLPARSVTSPSQRSIARFTASSASRLESTGAARSRPS